MRYCNPALHDLFLNGIRNTCNKMVLCSQAPANYNEANVTYALADVAMAPADFTLANGAVSGRQVTVAAKTGVPIDATGNPTVCALLDTVNLVLLYWTEENTAQIIYTGNTANIPAWAIENRDPIAT